MRVLEEHSTHLPPAVVTKPRLDTGETQRPGRASGAVEHRCTDSPAAFDQECWIHCISGAPGLRDSIAEDFLSVSRTPTRFEVDAFEVLIDVAVG